MIPAAFYIVFGTLLCAAAAESWFVGRELCAVTIIAAGIALVLFL